MSPMHVTLKAGVIVGHDERDACVKDPSQAFSLLVSEFFVVHFPRNFLFAFRQDGKRRLRCS